MFRHKGVRWLLFGRAVRSLVQAILTIVVPLYLIQLHFSAVLAGTLFTVSGLGSAVLLILVGLLSDRFGRKPILFLISLLSFLSVVLFVSTQNIWLLMLAAAVGTLGRGSTAGSGGAFGPYYPAEMALLTEQVPAENRNHLFAILSFVGVLTAAVGSLIGMLPKVSAPFQIGLVPLLWLSAALYLLVTLSVLPVPETKTKAMPIFTKNRSWRLIGKFSLTNAINGLGFGFLGPFLTYWFIARYGADAFQLGMLYLIVNILTAFPFLGAAYLADRFGAVPTVVFVRTLATTILIFLPFMPNFFWAGTLFGLRMIINTVANPLRQAFSMTVSKPEERASVSAISTIPAQVTSAISPVVGGILITDDFWSLPFEIAALFFYLNAFLYGLFFHKTPTAEPKNS